MSVLIKGMKMPKEGFVEILIRDDGTVQQTGQSYRIGCTDYYTPYVGEMPPIYNAVPIPPHGRLIDADALRVSLVFAEKTAEWAVPALRAVLMVIDEMPTIIPAEEGE